MRVVVAGLGVQGHKRRRIAGADFITEADPKNPEAKHRRLEDIPAASYDAALLCVPDDAKLELIDFLIKNGKHALVEKPLLGAESELQALEKKARAAGVFIYTAYNHRFEPHFVRMRDLLQSGKLGRIYHCRMFYGNGTARLVRDSAWRDQGAGVLPDLGSHLLDTVNFWFGSMASDYRVLSARCFENRAPDHVVIASSGKPQLELEMTLLSWRNHFTCDLFAEKGSAHIRSLCKWGPTTFTLRKRVLPSGRPSEDVETLEQPDPTWALEYAYFKSLCEKRAETDLSRDLWLQKTLRPLGERAVAAAAS